MIPHLSFLYYSENKLEHLECLYPSDNNCIFITEKISFTKGNNSHTKSKIEIIFTYWLEKTSDNENLPTLLT